MSSTSSRFWPVVMVAAACTAAPAAACDVPVFQYALQRWLPDAYHVLVFHRGPLPAAQAALVQRLQAAAEAAPSRPPANVQVWPVDVAADMPDWIAALHKRAAPHSLPYLVAVAPVHDTPANAEDPRSGLAASESSEDPPRAAPQPPAPAEPVIVWSGPLESEAVERLLDSPARRETARRLLTGHSSVWVMLDGDDPKANLALEESLQAQLDKLAQELARTASEDQDEPLAGSQPKAGNPDASEFESPLPSAPTQVRFSVLRIGRDDGREQVLRRLLQSQVPQLPQTGKPLLFPIFGRGRVLGGVDGGNIPESAVAEACAFLAGDCSCQIKEMSFGFDLLMSADWDSVPSAEAFTGVMPATALAATGAAPTATASGETGGFFGTGVVAAGMLALLVLAAAAGSLVLLRRPRGERQ